MPTPQTLQPTSLERTGRVVGLLYFLGTGAGVLSALALVPLADASDLLEQLAEDPGPAMLGAFFILVMALALAPIPLLVLPVLGTHSRPLAVGYVVMRSGLETGLYLASAVIWLLLVGLSREHTAHSAGELPLDSLFAAARELDHTMGDVALALVFGLGAVVFNLLLLRTGLVPRWISGWGILAAGLWAAAGIVAVFGLVGTRSTGQMVMALPIAVQEMVLAGWLVAKGFAPPTHPRVRPDRLRRRRPPARAAC